MADIDKELGYGEEDNGKGVFRFHDKALQDLDKLQGQVGAPSRAETIRYAMRWLQFFVDELEKGHKPCLEVEEGIREVLMPHTEEGCWEK